jgi:hypothetical protein
MCGGYMQTLCHFVQNTWASTDFGTGTNAPWVQKGSSASASSLPLALGWCDLGASDTPVCEDKRISFLFSQHGLELWKQLILNCL